MLKKILQTSLVLVFLTPSFPLQAEEEYVMSSLKCERTTILTCADKTGAPVTGVVKTLTDDGKVKQRESYKNGIKNGISITYNANGSVNQVINFQDGRTEGPSSQFYDLASADNTINLKWLANYENGRLSGCRRNFYETGHLKSETFYTTEAEVDTFYEFYPDGSLKSEENRKSGQAAQNNRQYRAGEKTRTPEPLTDREKQNLEILKKGLTENGFVLAPSSILGSVPTDKPSQDQPKTSPAPAPEPVKKPEPAPITQPAPKTAPEPALKPAPEPAPESITKPTPEPIAEPAPKSAPESALEQTAEPASAPAPEPAARKSAAAPAQMSAPDPASDSGLDSDMDSALEIFPESEDQAADPAPPSE